MNHKTIQQESNFSNLPASGTKEIVNTGENVGHPQSQKMFNSSEAERRHFPTTIGANEGYLILRILVRPE